MAKPNDAGGRSHSASNFLPRGQGFDVTKSLFYETSLQDPSYLEVFVYTDRLSYRPGDIVRVHGSSTAVSFDLEVARDTICPQVVHRATKLTASMEPLPPEFIEHGCGWPVVHEWRVPDELPSGFYTLTVVAEDAHGTRREHEHGFAVMAAKGMGGGDILLVLSTSTWLAYNDWGGANSYQGEAVPDDYHFVPRTSIHRPWARGFIWTPEGAPRKPHDVPPAPGAVPRYPPIEWAYARGFSKWYSNAGWASYERPFAHWLEREGYKIDIATQHDLHFEPEILDGYACALFVGHDEYWTREMREAVDDYVENGGYAARFAGNFLWQVRLEGADGSVQVCYKEFATTRDPLLETEPHRVTTTWESPLLNWPGAATFGLNGLRGIYAGVGSHAPRGSGGFTVYRPEHWAFAGTDLYYGDVFGAEARVFGYEVDGLDYTFDKGLPVPTFTDGAPPGIEILAMGLASNTEVMRGRKGDVSYYGDAAKGVATIRYGSSEGNLLGAGGRGAGMMVSFQRGRGEVFHAGTCEWVAGLKAREYFTEQVTRNVLDRFTNRRR